MKTSKLNILFCVHASSLGFLISSIHSPSALGIKEVLLIECETDVRSYIFICLTLVLISVVLVTAFKSTNTYWHNDILNTLRIHSPASTGLGLHLLSGAIQSFPAKLPYTNPDLLTQVSF